MSQFTELTNPPLAHEPQRSRWSTPLWWLMLITSIAIAVYATRYFILPTTDEHFGRYLLPLRFHVAGGIGALLAGPWQFSEKLRTRYLNLHRWLGRFYLIEVGLGSIAGLIMSAVSMEGLPSHLGFGILAVLWFFTGWKAYREIRRGEVDAHREWMIRNFALTLAAVTLRNWLPLMLFALHWSFHVSYIIVSWLCWIPNLLAAEWMIARRRSRIPVPL
jgi:uncharacterized membrane protein